MPTKGFIYIVTNPGMPGLLKIGKTSRMPDDRLNDIYQHTTWISPYPYELEWAMYMDDIDKAELRIHKLLKVLRVNPKREWFKLLPDSEWMKEIEVTDNDDEPEFYSGLTVSNGLNEIKKIFISYLNGSIIKNNKLYIAYCNDEDDVKLKPDLEYVWDKSTENVIPFQKTLDNELNIELIKYNY